MYHSLKSIVRRFAVLATGLCFWFGMDVAATVALADDAESNAKTEAEADAEAASRLQMHRYFQGRHIFESQCVPCHGERGRGDGPWAADLSQKPRNFRSGVFKFRTTAYGKLPTDDDLRRTIRSGISGTAMPMFAKLSDNDVTGLIVYLQSFSRRWKDPEAKAEPLALPEMPLWFRDSDTYAQHAKKGATKFAELCTSCHGPTGKGDGPASQTLIDIWENPIIPADLTNEHHKSGDAPEDLYRTIATGLDGTPMLGFHQILSEAQIWDLVAFIKSNEIAGQRSEESKPKAAE